MAFETLGTGLGWGTGPTITIDLAYEHRRVVSDMQYRFRVSVNAPSYGGYFGYKIALAITLDNSQKVSGVLIKDVNPYTWSSAITYTTDWLTVPGKVTGSTAAQITVYAQEGSSRNYRYNYSLTVEPGVSILSADNGTLGKEQNLTVTRYVSGYTHTVAYKCGSASGTITSKSSDTTIAWTPPISLAAQNTTGTSVDITFTITTYSGNSTVGTATKKISATIPSSVKPTATLTLDDPEGYYSAFGGYVQSKSKIRYSVNAYGSQGSTIRSYKVNVGSAIYTAQSATHSSLNASGSVTVTATVTDSRGRTATVTETVNVLQYYSPIVHSCTVVRCQSNGIPDDSGDYAVVTFSGDVAPVGNHNEATYTLYFRRAGAQTWNQTPIDYTGYTPRLVSTIIAAATSSAHEVYVAIDDKISSIAATIIPIPVAFEYLQIDTGINSVAVGQKAVEPDTFAVGLTTRLNGTVIGQVLGLGKAMEAIPDHADLNDYLGFGVYAIETNVGARTIQNAPWSEHDLTPHAGTLRCYSGTGSGRINGAYAYVIQEYVQYLGQYTARRYVRTGEDDSWEAGQWLLFYGT